jgi:hypothetical protein
MVMELCAGTEDQLDDAIGFRVALGVGLTGAPGAYLDSPNVPDPSTAPPEFSKIGLLRPVSDSSRNANAWHCLSPSETCSNWYGVRTLIPANVKCLNPN